MPLARQASQTGLLLLLLGRLCECERVCVCEAASFEAVDNMHHDHST